MTFGIVFTMLAAFLAAFLLFSITVFVHELGHFLAARWRGLVVEEFAIGMGQKVFGFRWRGVEYTLRLFPFGGFVKLPQMVAMEAVEGKSEQQAKDLPPASPWSKILTAFAGPLFSFLLAVVFAVLCFVTGVPQNQGLLTRTVGYVEPGSAADQAGIQPGDVIERIDGHRVSRWQGRFDGVVESLMLSKNERVSVEVLRAGQPLSFSVLPVKNPEMENLRMIGIEDYPSRPATVGQVIKGSPAEGAGLRKGDVITQVNGTVVTSPGLVGYLVGKAAGPVALQVLRGHDSFAVTVTPLLETTTKRRLIGVGWNMVDRKVVHIPPAEQITNGIFTIKRTMEALVSPKSGVGVRHLSGPVGIFDNLVNLLTVDWRLVLYFSVVLNVNLAIMNLLPIPVLDGGHIVLSLAEWIRRKPAEIRFVEMMHLASLAVILCFFLYVSFFDLNRSARKVRTFFEQTKDGKPAAEYQFEPAKP
ncbi:MAG: RIP metalloprotease RseP [Candidatus Methylacidiphilales bacterium]|nr:RIP metalloprotease RseP [Candidatus Methylacidiphilales bacterium]